MTWQLYQLRYRLLSPLHIGYQKIGNIQRTRHYVMARQMWGALTARLTRSALYGEWTPPPHVALGDYEKMGDLTNQHIAFSYFYPDIESESCPKPLFPYQSPSGLAYGFKDGKETLSYDVFTWRYLNSYASTALNYSANTAEEGSLHEIEFIAPQTRPDAPISAYEVYLTGYVFVHKDCKLDYWKTALRELQLGGERTSGWGRVRLAGEIQKLDEAEKKLFGMIEYDLSRERPVVKVETARPLLAHTSLPNGSAQSDITFKGDIEPLTSRIWDKDKGAGQCIKTDGVYYSPGTIFSRKQNSNQQPLEFSIGQYGLWKSI